jgi:hypothetical protein
MEVHVLLGPFSETTTTEAALSARIPELVRAGVGEMVANMTLVLRQHHKIRASPSSAVLTIPRLIRCYLQMLR